MRPRPTCVSATVSSARPIPRSARGRRAPTTRWQSPDIEVRNERNKTDPAFFNTPWVGHDNTVVAKVTNQGSVDAPQVTVDFSVKDYTVTTIPEESIGSDTRDVPTGATVEFSAPWNPPSEGHFCTVARIKLYQNPTTLQVEASQLEGRLAEQLRLFHRGERIPGGTADRERERFQPVQEADARAPGHGADAPILPDLPRDQDADAEPRRGAQGRGDVQVRHRDGMPQRPAFCFSTSAKPQAAMMKPDTKLMAIPNNAMVVGIAGDYPHRAGALAANSSAARRRGSRPAAARGSRNSRPGKILAGRVVTADGKGVAGGKVIVTLKGVERAKGKTYVTTRVNSSGDFRDKLPARWKTAQAY